MIKQFFISGLGANEKAFQRLENFGTTKIMVKWIPNEQNESLLNYSKRIIEEYKIAKSDIVVGLSFGGLVAQQIAEILKPEFIILISSFRTKDDLKFIFNKGLKLKLHRLIPEIRSTAMDNIIANYLNSGTSRSKTVLKEMIESTDLQLMRWSLEKIFKQNVPLSVNTIKYNLLGTSDRIIKPWKNKTTFMIEGGSHFMVYDEAKEISDIINRLLEEQEY